MKQKKFKKHIDPNIYTTILKKVHIISCYDQHGIVIFYNKTMISSKSTTMTHFKTKLISTTEPTSSNTYNYNL